MTRTTWIGASALLGLSMLFTQTGAMAQNAGGQNQPQAPSGNSQSQPAAPKQNNQPKADAPKQSDQPKADAGQKNQSSGQADQKSNRPVDPQSTDRNRASDKSSDRANDRASDKSSDRAPGADRSRQPSTDRSQNADRSRQQDTDRNRQQTDRSRQQDTDRNRQQTDRSRSETDRSRQQSADRSRQTDRSQQSTDRSRQQNSERSSAQRSQEVTAKDLGFAFASESTDRGLKINNITSRSIASRAEFHEGDIIVSVHDHRVTSQRDFIRYIDLDADERIPVVVLRDDREVTVYLDPTVIREEIVVSGHGWLGVDLEDRERRAAVIYSVHPGSPAERAGLRSGDLILAVEGTEIRSPEHLGEVIGGMRPGTEVEIEVDRNRRSMFVDATLGEKQQVATRRTEIR